MKKIYFALSLAAVSLMSTQSCIKCDQLMPRKNAPVVKEETVNATVVENTSYTYTLPAGSTSEISSPATHAKASSVAVTANGDLVYQYTPVANYVGTDVVIVTAHLNGSQQTSGGCFGSGVNSNSTHHHGGGNCGNHNGNDEQTIVTTLHINVTPATVTAKAATAIAGNTGLN